MIKCAFFLLLLPLALTAESFVVYSNADGGAGSLREAITLANENPGRDKIRFELDGDALILLNSPLPVITEEVDLRADADGDDDDERVTIDGRLISVGAPTVGLNLRSNNSRIQGIRLQNFTDGPPPNGLGIWVGGFGAGTVQGNKIIDVDIRASDGFNAGPAILLLDAVGTVVKHSSASGTTHLVLGLNADGSVIKKNEVQRATNRGIALFPSSGDTSDGNIVRNNTIVDTSGPGIQIVGVGNEVKGNLLCGNLPDEPIVSPAQANTVKNNKIVCAPLDDDDDS